MPDPGATDVMRSLGAGERPDEVMARLGWTTDAFEAWWSGESRRRLPNHDTTIRCDALRSGATIVRDDRGLPHVIAKDDHDLFIGYGYAQAQDRLFQLDIQRRKGHGRLAALIGREGVEHDRIAHTIGFPEVLRRHLAALDKATHDLLDAFAMGVELVASTAVAADGLPIEYPLLGADWEPWTLDDSLACALAWRWQFTGRPHVIAGPELLKRHLGDQRLVAAVLSASREADTPILPPDAEWPDAPEAAISDVRMGDATPHAADPSGSNDWVVAGSRTRSGLPLLGSDPHMPYQAWSAFHEVGLHGGSFDAVGAGLVGMPGLLFGRNRTLTWGITNNICSLRDLYQERPIAGTPDAFEHDGSPEVARVEHVSVEVRGAEPFELRVVRTRNGPLVDDLLPPVARGTGPVSMRWLGTEVCDWTAALLRLDRATTVRAAMEACEGWLVPTFSLVLGDTAGDIGYLATGRIPIRDIRERGYRPGWDPAHAWAGLIPTRAMPKAVSPAQGYLSSANNRPAPEAYPYPLSGTWDEGYRQRRIGRLIEAGASDGGGLTLADITRMHLDVRSLRAEERRDDLVRLIEAIAGKGDQPALELLRAWDLESTVDSAGAAIHHVLFARWAQAVMHERVADRDVADYLANWALGLAARLLVQDDVGWFAPGRRAEAARIAWRETLAELATALGPDPATWSWGAIHQLVLSHPLSRGTALSSLLDKPATPVPGDLATLDNSGFDASRDGRGWMATSGAGFRLEVDLGARPDAAWTITAESQSALVGSPHFDDQREEFVEGRVRRVPLDLAEIERMAVHVTRLEAERGRS